MMFSLPIVVWPCTTTFASSFDPSPIETSLPIKQYGPISTSRPIFAPGCTTAVAWMFSVWMLTLSPGLLIMASHVEDGRVELEQTRVRHDREHQERCADGIAVDVRLRVQAAVGLAQPFDMDVHHQSIARQHGTAEAHFVDAREIGHARRRGFRLEDDGAAQLCHRLDDEDARHHRVVREMSLEERFVEGDVLKTGGALERLELCDAIEQQHRIAMR